MLKNFYKRIIILKSYMKNTHVIIALDDCRLSPSYADFPVYWELRLSAMRKMLAIGFCCRHSQCGHR